MKIWFDILTPKQLLFFGPMIQKLGKSHKILCTSRAYSQVVDLAKIRRVNLLIVGRHGGPARKDKLHASARRTDLLADIIAKFSPDLAVSFCSPEAARVAFGLGVKHVVFSDSPHAEAVMRLALPLAQKLLIPWIIPKDEFTRYGISRKDIVQYRAIDAAAIIKSSPAVKPFRLGGKGRKVVVRLEESAAAYALEKSSKSGGIISELSKAGEYDVIVLARYSGQAEEVRKKFGGRVKILGRAVDGRALLSCTDIFIGSGGTMTAEAALMGIPTISYDAVPNSIEKYLVKTGLAKRETDPKKILSLTRRMLQSGGKNRQKARRVLDSMEDPYPKLLSVIRSL